MHRLVRVRRERAPRRGDVRRLRVVDEAHAGRLADGLEPVRHAGERAQRLGDRVVADPGRARGRGRGGGVLAVVRAADQRLGRQRVVGRELDPVEPEPARHDLRPRALEDAQLRVAVVLERVVAVEVIGLEVEQHRDRRRRTGATSSSWNDESSQTTQSASRTERERHADVPGDRRRRAPAARKIAPSSAVVVVLPFVPVTPTNREPGSSRKPSSTSDHTGTPRSRAATSSGIARRHAGRLHDARRRRRAATGRPRCRASGRPRTTSSPRSASRSVTACPGHAVGVVDERLHGSVSHGRICG